MSSSWLSRYRQASFRNVSFFVRSHTVSSGRRLVQHEFPGNNNVSVEDTGRKQKTFTIDAYITADDYFQQRAALEEALDADGSGTLVHPYRGDIEVHVDEWTQSESTDEGRMVRFSITFVLASPETLTVATLYTNLGAIEKKKSLLDAINKWFQEVYNATSLAVNKLTALTDALQVAVTLIENAKLLLKPFAEFQEIISNAKGKLITIALESEDLAKTLQNIIDFGTDAEQQVKPSSSAAIEQFKALLQHTSELTTSTDLAQEEQINILQTKLIIASTATLLIEIDFPSADEAQDFLDSWVMLIDSAVETFSSSDDEYEALADLRSFVYNIVNQKALQLSKLKTFVLSETMPSLAVSNTLYGSVDQEQSIISRNKIRHPGFIPGGVDLKVVTDV